MSPLMPMSENVHWLSALFQRDDPLPFAQLGVSILEAVDGHVKLEWSSLFETQGRDVESLAKDPTALGNAPAEFLRRIDNPASSIQSRTVIIQYLPRKNYRGWGSGDSVPESLALKNLHDVIRAKSELKPIFFIELLTKSISDQTAEWQALPSERDSICLEHPNGRYISALGLSLPLALGPQHIP